MSRQRRVSVQTWVLPELKKRLKNHSERTRIPMSAMVERALEIALVEYEEREEVYGEYLDRMEALENPGEKK